MGSSRTTRDVISNDLDSYESDFSIDDFNESDSSWTPCFSRRGLKRHLHEIAQRTTAGTEKTADSHSAQEKEKENLASGKNAFERTYRTRSSSSKKPKTEKDIQYKVPYYDPRSWVWKDKPDATFAVVIEAPSKSEETQGYLGERSAASQNVQVGIGEKSTDRTLGHISPLGTRGSRRWSQDLLKDHSNLNPRPYLRSSRPTILNTTSPRSSLKATNTYEQGLATRSRTNSVRMAAKRKKPDATQSDSDDTRSHRQPVKKSRAKTTSSKATSSKATSSKATSSKASSPDTSPLQDGEESEVPDPMDQGSPLEPNDEDDVDSVLWKKKQSDLADKFDGNSFRNGPDQSLPPLSELPEIFRDMVKNAINNLPEFKKAVLHLAKRKLRVATMCSGTESPVTAIKIMLENLQTELDLESPLKFEHLFSAEIVPFKQAFIELNFAPKLLFRDIIEMAQSEDKKATTAFGAKKSIPEDIDLLVAGFSCVDMSNLNRNKITLSEMGESGDTLMAIIEFAQKHKPKVIILENVDGAPWNPSTTGKKDGAKVPKTKPGQSIAEMWYANGYYCQHSRVDTKNYYIPHTRLRGYMICVSKSFMTMNPFYKGLPETKKYVDVDKKRQNFLQGMIKLERNASEPVEAFFLPETDERVVRGNNEDSQSGLRAVDWGTCEAEHTTYRVTAGLGTKKPLTHWTLGGSCRPHDALSQQWVRNQVERVKDSLDIMYLRNLRRGFDPLSKNRMIDLSQNVDRRSTDMTPSGYTGCVTPSGMPFSTVLGRLLVAEESLKLQGMDPDTLNVSQLTQRQLRDLAGNAMSCPTVGAVILCALSLTYKAIPQSSPDEDVEEVSDVDRIHELATERPSSDIVFGPLKKLPLDFPSRVIQSLRHCSCEGQSEFRSSKLLECQDCGHKACGKHSANPLHNYMQVAPSRTDPKKIRSLLGEVLPMSITFVIKDLPTILQQLEKTLEEFLPVTIAKPKKKKKKIEDFWGKGQVAPERLPTQWEHLQEILTKSQDSDIHFKNIDRTASCLECNFESEGDAVGALRLQLILSSQGLEWKLYAKTPKDRPNNCPLRLMLDQPIARMRPNIRTGSLMTGQWEVRLPKTEIFDITIQGTGKCVPAFEYLQGIPSFKNVTIWDKLVINVPGRSSNIQGRIISGGYDLHQQCGTPMGTLYKKEGEEGQEPIYLFFDPTRYGHPDEDSFVFSTDISPLKFKEVRSPIARLDNKWRPNSESQSWEDRPKFTEKGKPIKLELLGKDRIYQPSEADTQLTIQCSTEGSWCNLNASLDTNAKGTYSYLRGSDDLGCVFSSDYHTHDAVEEDSKMDISSSMPDDHSKGTSPFESCYTSVEALDVKVLARNLGFDETDWSTLNAQDCSKFLSKLSWLSERTRTTELSCDQWHEVSLHFQECHICAAPLPDVKWKFQRRAWKAGEKAKAKRTKYGVVPDIPDNEENQELVPYEDPEGSINYEKALKVRPSAFVVQYQNDEENRFHLKIGVNVKTLMHRAGASMPKADSRRSGPMQFSYRFSTNYDVLERAHLPPFSIPNNADGTVAPKPPNFELHLFEHQAKSLSWMISQEETEVHFKEERVVESALEELKWRSEGRAQREVSVRGGILADQVGYGKTPLILGLFDSRAARQPVPVVNALDGRISIKATLILVPNHLVDQWHSEFTKFIKSTAKYEVLVIRNAAAWKIHTVSDFMRADVIICPWTLVEHDDYLGRVAKFSGMLGFPKGSGIRAEKTWYKAARETLLEFTKGLLSSDMSTLRNFLADEFERNLEEAQSNSAIKPSIRLRGAQRQKAKLAAKNKTEDDDEETPLDTKSAREQYLREDALGLEQLKDWKDLKGPPFELFNFYRKVVDEYTYVAGQESDTIAHIGSECSWFLSGTPGLNDFVDAWRLMKLLGVDLGQPELTPGIITPQNIKTMSSERTQSEMFRALLHKPSFAWSKDRHEYAQSAINMFVRHNMTPIGKFPVYKHICPVELPAIDRAIYSELTFFVAASDMREKKALSLLSKAVDREGRITEIWKKEAATKLAPTAVGALMKCNLVNKNVEIDDLLLKREGELDKFRANVIRAFELARYRRSSEPAGSIPASYYTNFCGRIKNNEVGDGDVSRFLLQEIQDWKDIPAGVEDQPESDFTPPPGYKALPALRPLCNKLRDMCKQLVAAQRGVRFLKSVQVLRRRLEDPDSDEADETPLELKGCCTDTNENHLHPPDAVFAECGHLYCKACIDKNREAGLTTCTKKFCKPPSGFPYLIPKEEFGVAPIEGGANAKMMAIAELIKRIDKKEQVLLFTQFPDERTKMVKVLRDEGISHSVLDGVKDHEVGRALEAFRSNYPPMVKKGSSKAVIDQGTQVLVLSIDNVSAAGSNLTAANHVIFAFPYLASNQTRYETAMTQAIGRVCRHGQEKKIHVYHFLTLKTADVDVLEARTKSILVNDENLPADLQGEIDFDEYDTTESDDRPNIEQWEPSGFRLVKRDLFPVRENQRAPSGGEYSSHIHDKVVTCMDSSLEDDEEGDGDDDGEGGEDYDAEE